jgi:hypothetical protein
MTRLGRAPRSLGRGALLAALALVGCRAAPPPPPPDAVVAPPPPAEVAPPPLPVSTEPDPGERYAEALAQDVGGSRRLTPAGRYPGAPAVAAFRSRRRTFGVLYVTLGVGLAPRSAAGVPDEERRVELLARAEEAAPGVADVLQALAHALAAADAAGDPWRGYEPVALEPPVRGLGYFDLIPAGAARVEGADVTLLRVVPLTAEEYEASRAARGSQWGSASGADPEGADDARARWAPALRDEAAPDAPP